MPLGFILPYLTITFVGINNSHTTGGASKLVPKIQNVPSVGDERSSVLLTLTPRELLSLEGVTTQSHSCFIVCGFCCCCCCFVSPPPAVMGGGAMTGF